MSGHGRIENERRIVGEGTRDGGFVAHEGDVNTSLSLGMAETMVIFFLSSFSVFLLFSNVINIPPPLPEPAMLQLPEYLNLRYHLSNPSSN